MLDLERTLSNRFPAWFAGARAPVTKPLVKALGRVSRIDEVNAFLREHAHLGGFAFVEAALARLDCRWLVDHVERERIPHEGAVVIVANHPMGAIDALALLSFVGSIRRDVRILANDFLAEFFPGLGELLLPLRILGGRPSPDSLAAVDAALAAGMAVIVFPAGEVSRLTPAGIADTRWRRGFLRFADKARADVVPVHLGGRNSALFYGLSTIYKPLGTALLPREMFARGGSRIEIRVGHGRPARELLEETQGLDQALAVVRRSLYAIGKGRDAYVPKLAPLAHPPCLREQLDEIGRLEVLGETPDGKRILAGRLAPDSALLREIGRLRELTFRAVGEGTGRRLDVDRYDAWYEHIVLWDDGAREIVGAYRLVRVDEVLAERGLSGLYTASLFEFDRSLMPVLRQAVELGRSFVAPKHWGTRSLDWLWYGIGAWLRRHPEVRYLFGPVSISAALPEAAREQLVAYYRRHHGEARALARSRQPYEPAAIVPEFEALDADSAFRVLKANLDRLGARVPTLYKQYTELCEPGGARFLAFGTDPEFAGAIDGLILVDLSMLKPKKRQRYLGDDAPGRLSGPASEVSA
jgi:putative hemolysin